MAALPRRPDDAASEDHLRSPQAGSYGHQCIGQARLFLQFRYRCSGVTEQSTWVRLAPATALPCGNAVCVDADGVHVAVFHARGGFRAVADRCRHMGGPLSQGTISGETVICPWHGWTYDLRSGARTDRQGHAVTSYPIKNEDGWLFLGLPAEAAS
jgi:nitrite reductase (NADH) small subunit